MAKAETMGDALADRLAEVDVKTQGNTLAEVDFKVLS